MSIIEANNISVKYKNDYVFSNVSFSINKGDFVALAGPNGSGKSTLVRSILGLVEISSGLLKIFEKNIKDFKDWHKIGYVPQKINLSPFFPASVKEVVKMGLLNSKNTNYKKEDKILQVLNKLNIAELSEKNITELSGGQFQKVIIARAIVAEPELLILDEPTTALDPETREKFFELISNLNKNNNVTIVLVTHDTANTGKFANKLMYLDRRIIFYGTFEDFCKSENMSTYFGYNAQHIICNRH